jgi:3-hydroxy-9,10-secoandrosta-1,3,5(10)-triene-9,17-dione monooxygenase reductase component
VSHVFASKLPEREKFDGIPYEMRDGVPVLEGTLAWLVCDVQELIPGGDHTIAIGQVRQMHHGEGEPLLWYRGDYRSLDAARA